MKPHRCPIFTTYRIVVLTLAVATGAAHGDTTSDTLSAKLEAIRKACGVNDTETNPKKMDKSSACVERAIGALRRKASAERALNVAAVAGTTLSASSGAGLASALKPAGPTNVGNSATNTSSTCGAGAGSNNPLIRVHRLLMAPRNASDDFGYRLGRRYIIYQVTISNQNKDLQYLIHDVSIDMSSMFNQPSGTFVFQASSQDLSLLRGVPEKGQDLDPRNLTLHVLQGIGGVAGAITGLTPFSDVMGSSMGVFNGSFIQGFIGVAPDHTATQLNRLSDAAYIANTIVDKQRARTIAIFVPQATLLSPADQKLYWKDPYSFLQGNNFDKADICVDGSFITTIAAPTLTAAILTPKPLTATIGPNTAATLTVIGSNISTTDTEVVGLGSAVLLTSATDTLGSVDITLPANYTAGMPVHLASATNPSTVSNTIPTTVFMAPSLTSATLAVKAPSTAIGPNATVTVKVMGTNLNAFDTKLGGLGESVLLTSVAADGKSGSLDITLPPNYTTAMQVYLVSRTNPSVQTAPVTPK